MDSKTRSKANLEKYISVDGDCRYGFEGRVVSDLPQYQLAILERQKQLGYVLVT